MLSSKLLTGFSPDLSEHLDCAISSLASSLPTATYPDCLRAHVAIACALQSLASPSLPSTPRNSVARVPAELLFRIIDFAQSEPDRRVLQNLNVALSMACRTTNRQVKPILEKHKDIFTPLQLERLAALARNTDTGEGKVESLTVDLHLDDLKAKGTKWIGRLFQPYLEHLFRTGKLRSVRVYLRSSDYARGVPDGYHDAYETKYGEEVLQALGLDEGSWFDVLSSWSLDGIEVLELPALSASHADNCIPHRSLFEKPSTLRTLRLGRQFPPYLFNPANFHRDRTLHERMQASRWEQGKPLIDPTYDEFSLPFFAVQPADLVPLVLPSDPSAQPSLRHLEITLRLNNLQADLNLVCEIFSRLAPCLTHLVLRFKFEEDDDTRYDSIRTFHTTFGPALSKLTALEHLELGGKLVECEIRGVSELPSLHSFVLLPMDEQANLYEIIDDLAALPSTIRTLTVCTPELARQDTHGYWSRLNVRRIIEGCEKPGRSFKLEERPAEYAWLNSTADE